MIFTLSENNRLDSSFKLQKNICSFEDKKTPPLGPKNIQFITNKLFNLKLINKLAQILSRALKTINNKKIRLLIILNMVGV